MKVKVMSLAVLFLTGSMAMAQAAQPATAAPAKAQNRIEREVRHELLMQPYYSVFDIIKYTVNGYNVTLTGEVTRPSIKADAISAVKGIEGVEQVNDQINVLPPSPNDDRLRLEVFRAVYGFPSLQKYDLGTIKPIRIIVDRGHVTLEGVVDNETDKNTAEVRASAVPGILGKITNNLQVPAESAKK